MRAALSLDNPSLADRVSDLELLAATLAAMDDHTLTAEDREFFESEITAALAGTREKIDRTASLLASLEADEAAAAAEVARLQARITAKAGQRARLEAYMIRTLMESGVKQFVGYTSTLAFRINPAAVVVDPDAEVPAAFIRLVRYRI